MTTHEYISRAIKALTTGQPRLASLYMQTATNQIRGTR